MQNQDWDTGYSTPGSNSKWHTASLKKKKITEPSEHVMKSMKNAHKHTCLKFYQSLFHNATPNKGN